jgi:hypothetical protein
MRIASFQFDNQPSTPWERIVQNKAESRDLSDRSSIFVGLDMDSQLPVCIPRHTLETSHYHVRGMSGSGKTAAALTPLALQILRGYKLPDGQQAPKCPVVILDLKGDQAFFNTVWEASLRAGQKFRYFSTRKGDDYHFFDPFQMLRLGHLLPIQLATEFVRAFSLDYGLIYGGLYFTHQNLDILRQAIEEMLSRPNAKLTIDVLARILVRLGKTAKNSDARHIEACLNLLAAYPPVNIARNQAPAHQVIDMRQALDDCEVLYFFMQMEGEAPSLRQVASLALYSLVEAAKHRYHQGLPRRDTYVIIDEFYHIAGKSFGELLSTVRAWGLHMVLANQNLEQLKTHDPSLPDIVSANIGVEQAFTWPPDEEEYFQKAAGETSEYLHSYNYSTRSEGYSLSEHKTSFLSDRDLKNVNDTLLASLMLIRDGKPSEPGKRVLKVQALYPLSFERYSHFENTPFPQRPWEPFEPSEPAPSSDQAAARPAADANNSMSPEMASLDQRMATKWRELATDAVQRIED